MKVAQRNTPTKEARKPMADVHVFVTNNSGQTAGLTLDENDDMVEHLKRMQRRDEVAKVEVKKIPKAAASKAAESKTNES
jgi:hypothetical protein